MSVQMVVPQGETSRDATKISVSVVVNVEKWAKKLRTKLMASFIHPSTFILLWQLHGENHIDIMH